MMEAERSGRQVGVTYAGLLGEWDLVRSITGQGPITGRAVFTPEGIERLRYREHVVITSDEKKVKAHREYVYLFSRDSIEIIHGSGENIGEHFLRLVPAWDPSRGEFVAAGSHLCKLDLYDGEFRFALPASFSSTYLVKGPSKDYRIETSYKRAS
jgi:hypothetical protein